MIKYIIISTIVFFNLINIVSASEDTNLNNKRITIITPFISCQMRSIQSSMFLSSFTGLYEDATWKITRTASLKIDSDCSKTSFVSYQKLLAQKQDPSSFNDFLIGLTDMFDIFTSVKTNAQAFKVNGNGRKPKIGEIHILPGGYKKIYTKSGKWKTLTSEEYNYRSIVPIKF